jgi:hypothetical protein
VLAAYLGCASYMCWAYRWQGVELDGEEKTAKSLY